MSDYTRLVGDLTGSVRVLGAYDGSNQRNGFITPNFLIQRTSANHKVAYELLATADPDRVTVTSQYTLTSTTGSYPLPTDIFRLRAVDVRVGDRWDRLMRDDPSPLNSPWELTTGFVGLTAARYRLEGDHVFVSPDQSAGTVFRTTYIPAPVELTSSLQTIDGTAGVDELTNWMTLADCLQREDRDARFALSKVESETKRIKAMARDRDRGQGKSLEDPLRGRRSWRSRFR